MDKENRNELKDTESVLMVVRVGGGDRGMGEGREGVRKYNLVVTR